MQKLSQKSSSPIGHISLRDVLFLCHAKPKDDAQGELWKRLIDNKLKTPDTWEVALSATSGDNKKDAWERLLAESKLGGLALLRNLRNFKECGVNENLVRDALKSMKTERVLPYRFVTAAKYAPNLEPELEEAMFKAVDSRGVKIGGKTVLLIDVSGSMKHAVSSKSDSTRFDAATGLAILARELFNDVEVYTFSDNLVQVPTRRGFALRDAILNSQRHANTYLGKAVKAINEKVNYDRLVVFTDEQSADNIGVPQKNGNGYVINVASNKNGVGYGSWNHIDGFSESALDYIIQFEQLSGE
jgi:60 kDa SS-A/Ro ribonucleoprotein